MPGGAKALGTIQPDFRGHDGPVILPRATGGQQPVLNHHLLLADPRQTAGMATHLRAMEQEGGGIDVKAPGLDVIVRVISGQQEAGAPADQRPLNRHRAFGLIVQCLRAAHLELALANAHVALKKQFLVYLVAGIQATGLQRQVGGSSAGKGAADTRFRAGGQVTTLTERGQRLAGILRQLSPRPPVNLGRRRRSLGVTIGTSQPQHARQQQPSIPALPPGVRRLQWAFGT